MVEDKEGERAELVVVVVSLFVLQVQCNVTIRKAREQVEHKKGILKSAGKRSKNRN